MASDLRWRQHFYIRRTVEQGRLILVMDGQAKLAVGFRIVVGLAYNPSTVQLVVSVNAQVIN